MWDSACEPVGCYAISRQTASELNSIVGQLAGVVELLGVEEKNPTLLVTGNFRSKVLTVKVKAKDTRGKL